MELSSIASKHKKAAAVRAVMRESEVDDSVKARADEVLQSYSNLLIKVWQQQSVSEDDSSRVRDLERQLDRAHEELRLFARPSRALHGKTHLSGK